MPYIPQQTRKQLDPELEALTAKILELADRDNLGGNLNYCFTKIAKGLLNEAKGGYPTRYRTLAEIKGALDNASAEFYRQVVAPYEDKKIASDGDVE